MLAESEKTFNSSSTETVPPKEQPPMPSPVEELENFTSSSTTTTATATPPRSRRPSLSPLDTSFVNNSSGYEMPSSSSFPSSSFPADPTAVGDQEHFYKMMTTAEEEKDHHNGEDDDENGPGTTKTAFASSTCPSAFATPTTTTTTRPSAKKSVEWSSQLVSAWDEAPELPQEASVAEEEKGESGVGEEKKVKEENKKKKEDQEITTRHSLTRRKNKKLPSPSSKNLLPTSSQSGATTTTSLPPGHLSQTATATSKDHLLHPLTPLFDWVNIATCHLFQGKQKHGLAFILYPIVVAWNASSTAAVSGGDSTSSSAIIINNATTTIPAGGDDPNGGAAAGWWWLVLLLTSQLDILSSAAASLFILVLNIFLFELANIGEAHDKGCHDYRCCPPNRSQGGGGGSYLYGGSNFFCAKGLARFWWLLFAVIQQLVCTIVFGLFSVQQFQCLAVSIGTYIYTYGRGSRNTIYKAWFTAFLGGGAHPWTVSTVQKAGHWIHYALFVCTPSMMGDCLSDCRDIEGDRKEGRRTLPMILSDLFGGSETYGRTGVCCVGFLSVAYLHFVAAATPLVLLNIFASTMCVLLPTLWPKTFKKKMWWDRKSLDIYYLTYVYWAGQVELDSNSAICQSFEC